MEIRFGPFVLDLAGHQLLREHRRVSLSPKVYQLLCVLAEERPRALSRQELHARLWPGALVSDVTLACLVNELRTALGECRHLVRTVHRFGYAFDVPPARGAAEARGRVAPPLVVMVLPVAVLDGRSETAAAAAELTDELVTRLGATPGFAVVPVCTASAVVREAVDLPRLARQRGIAFLVEASLRADAAGLRLNVRLIDVASGSSVWSDRMLTCSRELPDLEGGLAGALAEEMLAVGPRKPVAPRTSGGEPGECGEEEPTVGHA